MGGRIGGAVVQLGACSRREHWLPLVGRHGKLLEGRGGKPAMLHVYLSYVSVALGSAGSPSPVAAPSGNGLPPPASRAHKQNVPLPSRQSDSHELAAGAGNMKGSLTYTEDGQTVTRGNCRIGEKLWVIEDAEEVRRLTDKSSGISWNDDMADCCGTQGEVVAVLDKYVGMR